MAVVLMLKWWYKDGWHNFMSGFKLRFRNAVDFFSLKLLTQNLFAPFRQISASEVGGRDLGSQMSAFSDRLFSRMIGFVARLVLLIVGAFSIVAEMVLGAVVAVLWPLAPAVMVVSFILFMIGGINV